ncbi:sensor histidine kinase [Knoellia sp. CPCC 206450]|uniref:sensor histidine kinase n=1 Tax=Knoellia tibetensis TaxID=3404798 RepID=UPI003B436FC4
MGAHPGQHPGGARVRWIPRTSPFNARAVLLCSWVASAALVAANAAGRLMTTDSPSDLARIVAGLLAFGGAAGTFAHLQVRLLRDRPPAATTWVLLALGMLPLGWGSPNAALAFGVAAVLLCVEPVRAVATLVAAGALFITLYRDGGGLTQVSAPGALAEITVVGVVFAVLTVLATTLDRLQRAREQLARQRVDRERERIARDLHDLMGRTLITASLRSELLKRIVDDRQPLVHARLEQLSDTLTMGQERVRAVTSGPVISSWEDELAISRSLCARVGISFSLAVGGPLPTAHLHVAALVLREMVTAALTQSRSGRVEVRLHSGADGSSIVRVTHDSAGRHVEQVVLPERLIQAVGRAGGRIQAVGEDGRWSVEATLAATPETA